MCSYRSKVLAGSDDGVEKFLFEFDVTTASDLPDSGEIDGMKIGNGSTGMITGSVDTGAFYIYDEENVQWNKAGGA